VIIVAHRPSALAAVDHVLAMVRGAQQAFGPKSEVLARPSRRESNAPAPLKVVPQTNG
jgi:ATP-binding cassette, subfamily C, type I secretion system permease/ATPase